jgi:hypothetical protein
VEELSRLLVPLIRRSRQERALLVAERDAAAYEADMRTLTRIARAVRRLRPRVALQS